MPRQLGKSRFRDEFCHRLKDLREKAEETQVTMARKLEIDPRAYAKYETRTPLPPHLIVRVCAILSVTSWFLLTGSNIGEPGREPAPEPRLPFKKRA